MFGVDLNYFLTDVLWIGLQGQYFIKQLTNQDELVGLQYNRTSDAQPYLYGGAFNFGYVPVYGKFALFNRAIMHWEIWASAGVGVTFTEVIPRDPANAVAGVQEHGADAQRRPRRPLLPVRLADRELRASRLHRPRQVRAEPPTRPA